MSNFVKAHAALFSKVSNLGVPNINIDEPEFDQSTYINRAKSFFISTNPLMCLKTSSHITAAQSLVSEYKAGTLKRSVTERELWLAKRIIESAIHPATGRKIPVTMRMCAFVPMNMGLVVGMFSATTIPATIFWQSVNQTYNVCVNYANRGTGGGSEKKEIFRNYIAALTSAVGSAVGLNFWINSTTMFSASTKNVLLRIVPWVAVSFANLVNVSITRSQELSQGTTVYDEHGTLIGQSAIAGRKAVALTVLSRVSIATLIMGVTPIMAYGVNSIPFFAARSAFHLPVELTCSALVLAFALPMSLALFKQKQRIDPKKLEEKFKKYRLKDGSSPKYVFFNKGL